LVVEVDAINFLLLVAPHHDIRSFHIAGADVVVYVGIALIMLQAYV
jgi:hypothetical protein